MRWLRWGYIALVHLLLLVALLGSDALDRVARHLGLWSKPPFEFFWTEAVSGRPVVNFGISYDTTAGVQQRLPLFRSLFTAGAVVLLVGLNDLRYPGDGLLRDAMSIGTDYRNLLYRVPNDVPVVAVSVPPIDEVVAGGGMQGARNADIAQLNAEIRQACSARPRCRYADAWPGLTEGGAGLYPKYHRGDGVVLNAAGNRQLAATIKTALDGASGG